MTTGDGNSEIDVTKLSLTKAAEKLGEPVTKVFRLTSDVDEFRIELLNFFSEQELADDPPQITEATWSIAEDRNLTVWYRSSDGVLIYQHHLLWHPGQEF